MVSLFPFLISRTDGVCWPRDMVVVRTYISGSFCVSITAAIGIPKFDAGPQKSVTKTKSANHQSD